MNIKLVIADVDGTLVTKSKQLTAQTSEAVARLRAGGVMFTVTSGRPPRGMASLVAPLKLTAPLAAFNGGIYVKPDLKTVLAQHTIPPEVAKLSVDYLLKAGLDVWVYQGVEWFLRNPEAFRVARERSNVGFDPIVVKDLHGVLEASIKIVGVSEDRSLVERCEAELGARLGGDASAARSTSFYLDVTHPEANKGMVLREASRLLHIPLEQIAAVGDMSNDVPMLSVAGLGIAMGNANEDVQRVARHVTRSNDENGFAHAVDSFILGAPPVARTKLGLPPRIRGCLFGLDGVLTQMANLHAEAWKKLCDVYLLKRTRQLNVPFVPFDLVRDYSLHFDNKSSAEGLGSFLASRQIELPEQIIRALIERKGEILGELLRSERVATFEGSVRYVQAVRTAGLRTGVIFSSENCHDALRSAGIAELFDAQIDCVPAAATEFHEAAPKPNPYRAAAEAVGVDADQVAVFEDELSGVSDSRAGHLGYIVGVDRLGRADELCRLGADVVVPDLSVLLMQDGAAASQQP